MRRLFSPRARPAPPTGASPSPIPPFDEAFVAKLAKLAVLAKRVQAGAARGQRRTHRSGSGLEFADHRDYVPGDDLRRLDWNVYGRLERPLVRLYDEDDELSLYLLVDRSASMGIGRPAKLALAAQTAAALAYVGLASLDRVTMHPIDDELGTGFGPRRGRGVVPEALAFLEALRPAGRTDLRAVVTRFLARHRQRGVVVILSDFFDVRGCDAALDGLRTRRFEPVVVQITASEDGAPELDDQVVIVDVETGLEQEMTITRTVRDDYRRRYDGRLRALDRYCRQRGIPCLQIPSTTSFEDLVLRLFRTSGILG
jgi:uncharacterized protein (DUF58 family)